jgi:hypothetical protein
VVLLKVEKVVIKLLQEEGVVLVFVVDVLLYRKPV